jgi:hypothetical protein
LGQAFPFTPEVDAMVTCRPLIAISDQAFDKGTDQDGRRENDTYDRYLFTFLAVHGFS